MSNRQSCKRSHDFRWWLITLTGNVPSRDNICAAPCITFILVLLYIEQPHAENLYQESNGKLRYEPGSMESSNKMDNITNLVVVFNCLFIVPALWPLLDKHACTVHTV